MADLYYDGNEIVTMIKGSSFFPVNTGHLKNDATDGSLINNNTFVITFKEDIAPYVEYLEEGTRSHDIPGAFGRDLPFGIGGRFNDHFHPGSTKHYHFISEKSVNAVIMYYLMKYGGELK